MFLRALLQILAGAGVCAGNAAAFRQGRQASGATCAGLSGCSISCSVIN